MFEDAPIHTLTSEHALIAAEIVAAQPDLHNEVIPEDFTATDKLLVAAVAYGALFARIARQLGMEPSTGLFMFGDTMKRAEELSH